MPVYTRHDIALDTDGDLLVNPAGDIEISTTMQGLKQQIDFRIKTAAADWLDPANVADIGRFIGRGNTEENGSRIRDEVARALGSDLSINPIQLQVEVVPSSPTEIILYVKMDNIVTDDGMVMSLSSAYSLDFTTGYIEGII